MNVFCVIAEPVPNQVAIFDQQLAQGCMNNHCIHKGVFMARRRAFSVEIQSGRIECDELAGFHESLQVYEVHIQLGVDGVLAGELPFGRRLPAYAGESPYSKRSAIILSAGGSSPKKYCQ